MSKVSLTGQAGLTDRKMLGRVGRMRHFSVVLLKRCSFDEDSRNMDQDLWSVHIYVNSFRLLQCLAFIYNQVL